jgi:hypothetical protein
MVAYRCGFLLFLVWAAAAQQQPADDALARWKRLSFGTTATGSVYVPLDSWIYPAMERLIAWGYIDRAFIAMRPWTRLVCVQMLERAENRFIEDGGSTEARRVYDTIDPAATRSSPSSSTSSCIKTSWGDVSPLPLGEWPLGSWSWD